MFINPIDISDNTIPNANSIMLINFSRLGFMDEAKNYQTFKWLFKYL